MPVNLSSALAVVTAWRVLSEKMLAWVLQVENKPYFDERFVLDVVSVFVVVHLVQISLDPSASMAQRRLTDSDGFGFHHG